VVLRIKIFHLPNVYLCLNEIGCFDPSSVSDLTSRYCKSRPGDRGQLVLNVGGLQFQTWSEKKEANVYKCTLGHSASIKFEPHVIMMSFIMINVNVII
jgi:hypothetical protein